MNDGCSLKDNSPGTCQPAGSCKWAIDSIRQNKLKSTDLVRCLVRGVDNVICCGDNAVSRSSRSYTACQKYINLTYSIKKVSLGEHILGGELSLIGEYPHMAAIGFPSQEVGSDLLWDCGGSLISERFILTAAHCVTDRTKRPSVIRMGKVTLNTDADFSIAQDFGVEVWAKCTNKIITYIQFHSLFFQSIHIHPDYSSRSKYNDVALIRLKTKPIMDDKVRPACISFDETTLDRNAEVTVAGFGITNDTSKIINII